MIGGSSWRILIHLGLDTVIDNARWVSYRDSTRGIRYIPVNLSAHLQGYLVKKHIYYIS